MISEHEPSELRWFRCLLAVACLGLLWSTGPLWTGQVEFPQIPWFHWGIAVPRAIDPALLIVLVASLGGMATWPGEHRLGRTSTTIAWLSFSGLLMLDQLRLQPWAYQFWLLLGVLSLSPGNRVRPLCRVVILSLYFWSAVTKFDRGFVQGHGQMLVDGLTQTLHLTEVFKTAAAREALAFSMPVAEMLTAVLLVVPAWRRAGVWVSAGLHSLILLTVGPWGLNHEGGVLLWNAYFIGQNFLLFGRHDRLPSPETIAPQAIAASAGAGGGAGGEVRAGAESAAIARPAGRLAGAGCLAATGLVAVAALMPASNPWGYWDNWPSWSVYSAHPAIVQVLIAGEAVEALPESLRPWVGEAGPVADLRPLRIEQWCFGTFSAPPYPQLRWKLGVIAAVTWQSQLESGVIVRILERRNWRDTTRDETVLADLHELKAYQARYSINTLPRQ